jgi:uncharacterized protein
VARVVHFELPADDPERAIDFYSRVFGWNFGRCEGPMEYSLVTTGREEEPGIDRGLARRQDSSTGIKNTIGIESVDEAIEKIEADDGRILRPKDAVPEVGWLAYCEDTEGNTFGFMQKDPSAA